jgi:hypothetical protein
VRAAAVAIAASPLGDHRATLDPVTAIEPAIADLLGRDGVDYVHVRDAQAGCYDCRIERS